MAERPRMAGDAPPGDDDAPGGERARDPLVSVVIPAYNAAGFIHEAIDSVLTQTYAEREVIVINDGSPDSDALEVVLSRYADRVRYLRQPNRGPSAARNAGIAAARGALVAFLDSDDRWLPEMLAAQVELLRGPPPLDLAYCDASFFGDHDAAGATFMQEHPSNGPVTLDSLMRAHCVVLTSSVVARREALVEAGLFDETLRYSEDFDLWLRVAANGRALGYQKRVLVERRAHAESLTARRGEFLRTQMAVLERARERYALDGGARVALDRRIALVAAELALVDGKARLLEREYAQARREFQHAAGYFRSLKMHGVLMMMRLSPGLLRHLVRFRERGERGTA